MGGGGPFNVNNPGPLIPSGNGFWGGGTQSPQGPTGTTSYPNPNGNTAGWIVDPTTGQMVPNPNAGVSTGPYPINNFGGGNPNPWNNPQSDPRLRGQTGPYVRM